MKRKKIFNLLNVAILAIIGFSCENQREDEGDNISAKGQIEAKVRPNEDNKISFWASSQKITIDWGDGSIEELTPTGVLNEFIHEYANQNLQTIQINSTDLIAIGGSENFPIGGTFQELKFTNCPKLQEIAYANQSLTVLEVEKAEALTLINCRNNQLPAHSLNSLFNNLPNVSNGYIDYEGNIGSETCDFEIAGNKGWAEDSLVEVGFESFFSIDENIKIYLDHIFEMTGKLIQSFYFFESLYSNTIDENRQSEFRQYINIYQHDINPVNNFVFDIWKNSYLAIRQQIAIINHASALNKLEIHTVMVLRAYIYFIMINCWGDVVFIDDVDNIMNVELIKRESQTVILSKLLQDLLEAEQNLPEPENNSNRLFSKYAAQYLLTAIYTYQKDYRKALQYSSKIIDSNRFSLSSDYDDIFNNSDNKETIASLAAKDDPENDRYWPLIKKGKYIPFARYASLLLLAAENNLQINQLQEATALVNKLRTRNKRPLLESNSTVTQITNAILEEYRLDLGQEGLYFFALKRFDLSESILNIAPYRKYLPVPSWEIDTHPSVTQNEGY
jgi:hypothetical protein